MKPSRGFLYTLQFENHSQVAFLLGGSAPVSIYQAWVDIDLKILAQVPGSPPNTKFCSVLPSAAVLLSILQDLYGDDVMAVSFCLFFSLCYSLPTNVEILLRTDLVLPFGQTPCLLNCSPVCHLGMPVPIHPVSSLDDWWIGLISDNVVATFISRLDIVTFLPFVCQRWQGIWKAGGKSSRESIRVSDSCKTICARQDCLQITPVCTNQGLLSTNYFWIRKG